MYRRELIRNMAMMASALASPSLLHAVVSGVDGRELIRTPRLNEQQRRMCALLSEMIIPETDTPGAIAAGVPHFVELMVSDWYTDTESMIFLDGLNQLDEFCQQHRAPNFLSADREMQHAALDYMQDVADDYKSKAGGSLLSSGTDENTPFFSKLKELTVIGYYTSEVGATQELSYQPMPMDYRDIELADVGRQFTS